MMITQQFNLSYFVPVYNKVVSFMIKMNTNQPSIMYRYEEDNEGEWMELPDKVYGIFFYKPSSGNELSMDSIYRRIQNVGDELSLCVMLNDYGQPLPTSYGKVIEVYRLIRQYYLLLLELEKSRANRMLCLENITEIQGDIEKNKLALEKDIEKNLESVNILSTKYGIDI